MIDPRSPGFLDQLGIPLVLDGGSQQYVCPENNRETASVSIDEGLILSALAFGRNVLEIGTGLGVSTLCMAQTADLLTTVDTDPWVRRNVLLPQKVHRITEYPFSLAHSYSMAFIDGDHDEESVRRDIELCSEYVLQGDLMVFHDYNQQPVKRVVDEWAGLRRKLTYHTVGELTVVIV